MIKNRIPRIRIDETDWHQWSARDNLLFCRTYFVVKRFLDTGHWNSTKWCFITKTDSVKL